MSKGYLHMVAALMLALPLLCIGIAALVARDGSTGGWDLVGDWFVFWAVGVRLLLAGLRQATQPAFTAEKIFGITSSESHVFVRELGFANICMGSAGVISLWAASWRPAAAFVGGLYLGLAGVMHAVKGAETRNERIALVSDLFVFAVMARYFLHVVRSA